MAIGPVVGELVVKSLVGVVFAVIFPLGYQRVRIVVAPWFDSHFLGTVRDVPFVASAYLRSFVVVQIRGVGIGSVLRCTSHFFTPFFLLSLAFSSSGLISFSFLFLFHKLWSLLLHELH